MPGAAAIEAAGALWKDLSAPVLQRCLAARAIGLLAKHGPSWRVKDVAIDHNASVLARARNHGTPDASRRRLAEERSRKIEEAAQKPLQVGAASAAEVIRILRGILALAVVASVG